VHRDADIANNRPFEPRVGYQHNVGFPSRSDPSQTPAFGELLRSARRAAHLTQQALADASGIGRGSIAQYETGRYLPHRDECEAVAERLERALNLEGPVVASRRLGAAAVSGWQARSGHRTDERLIAFMADRSRSISRTGGVLTHEDGRVLMSRLERLFAGIQRAEQHGSAAALQQALVAAEELERLERSYPAASSLRAQRARILEGASEWKRALADLQWTIEQSPMPSTTDVVLAGTNLLTLGEYELSERVLRDVAKDLISAQENRRLRHPPEADRRQADLFQALSLLIWIDDYRGAFAIVQTESRRLLGTPRLAQEQRAGLLHRLGRSYLTSALSEGSPSVAARALDLLKEARRLAGSGNLFHDLWIARAAEATGERSRMALRGRAEERTRATGGSAVAHLNLDKGRELSNNGKYARAEEELRLALGIWAEHHYAKGGFDALLAIAALYERVGEKSRAAWAYRASIALGRRMQLHTLPLAKEGLARSGQTVEMPVSTDALLDVEWVDEDLRIAVSDLLGRISFRWQ
jgi:transcriptional regulator with XRE-family HTH domain